jgi:hypothetical protein
MSARREGELADLDTVLGGDYSLNFEDTRANFSRRNARNLIRSGCAYIEYMLNSLSEIIQEGDYLGRFVISEFDLEFLRDRILCIDEAGKKKTRPVRLPILGRISRKIDILYDAIGDEDFERIDKSLIVSVFSKRDHLMHPRSSRDVDVTVDDFLDCARLVNQVLGVRLYFMNKYQEISVQSADFFAKMKITIEI